MRPAASGVSGSGSARCGWFVLRCRRLLAGRCRIVHAVRQGRISHAVCIASIHADATLSIPPYRYLERAPHSTNGTAGKRSQDLRRGEAPRTHASSAHRICLVGGEEVHVRDQEPLCRGNLELDSDLTFEDFVEKINGLVFFRPGGQDGPFQPGHRHFRRYRCEKPALIRVCTQALFHANRCATPLFCRYNSGAPRCSKGKTSPRGTRTFLDADSFPDTLGKVIETTFPDSVVLPEDATEIGRTPEGSWKPFFSK